MKIVTNRCFGGFSLSHKAVMEYAKRMGIVLYSSDRPYSSEKRKFFIYFLVPVEEYLRLYETNDAALDEVTFSERDIPRDDPVLVSVVEDLGGEANGIYAELHITEIPDGVDWEIEEFDGREWVSEKHRTW